MTAQDSPVKGPMLTLAENATTIVSQLQSQGEDVNLRIAPVPGEEVGFGITAATQPEPGDQVVEQDGAVVYVESEAAETLSDAVLDAGVDESGNVQFALGQQA